MRLDESDQRRTVGFFPDVPIMDPGELAQADTATGLGHSCQPEVNTIGENGSEKDVAVIGRSAIPLMGEAGREAGPGIDFKQQVGDFHAWYQAVGGVSRSFGFVRHVGAQWGNFQLAVRDGGVGQSASLRQAGHDIEVLFQGLSTAGDIRLEHRIDAERQRGRRFQCFKGRQRNQGGFKGLILAATLYLDIPGTKSLPQLPDCADFVGAAVDRALPDDKGPPRPTDKTGRHRCWQNPFTRVPRFADQANRL